MVIRQGGQVGGDVTSLAVSVGGFDLRQSILDGLIAQGPCRVVPGAPAP